MRRVLAFAARTPPREVQLWDVGPNPTDYGVHLWTDRSAAEVFAIYNARGNPLVVDLEHNIGKGPEVPDPLAPTGGYARLELRDGAPWAVFEWSALAEEQIATGQRRFISPEYLTDKATGEIVGIQRISLVADPGTHHARVLASAPSLKGSPMDPMILAALKASLSAEDPKAAIQALLEELEKAGGAPGAESPAEGDAAAAADAGGDAGAEKPKPYGATSGAGTDDEGAVTAAAADPQACAAGEGEAGKAPVAAGAAPAPRQPPAMPTLPKKVTVRAAAAVDPPAGPSPADAIARADDLERDMLIRDHGEQLSPAIKTWASAQSLKVVKSYLSSLPSTLAPPAQAHATRGGQLSATGTPVRRHLAGEARREYEAAMGHTKPVKIGHSTSPEGHLRISAGCPGEYRAQEEAARVASAGK